MPFVNRFASPYAPPERGPFAALRKHPVIVLSGAATGGVLLGAYVAVQLFATPMPDSDGANALRASAEIKPAPPIAETTGSSSGAAGSRTASADCDQQTWPYLSRDCMKNGGVRIVPPDRPRSPTTEHAKVDAAEPEPVATTPAVAAPVATAPAITKPVAAPAAPVKTTAAVEAKDKDVKAAKAKNERIAKKTRRKAKAPAKQRLDEDDGAFASNDDVDVRVERRPGRSAHIVRRWTERDYDVSDDRGEGRRRVTVIRRGGGNDNPFDALFGGFGN